MEPLGNARRPLQALFGSANTAPRRGTFVTFNGSVLEVYDRDEVASLDPQIGGLYTNFIGSVDVERYSATSHIAASGGVNLRYYTAASDFLAADYLGGLGVETRVAPQTTLRINSAMGYSLVALPGLFPTPVPPDVGDPLPPGSIYAVSRDKFLTAAATASVEHRFTVRSQLVARGAFRYNHYFAEDAQTTDWSTVDSGVAYRYRVTSTRSLRAGYNYRRASYAWTEAPGGQGPQPDEHNFFVGVAVDRPYAEAQRTMLSFEGGTSVFSATAPSGLLAADDRLRFVYDASVAHQFGRSWLVIGGLNRGSQFDQGYGGPVFADAVTASVTGFFSIRTDVSASFAHTDGESLLAIAGQQFTMTTFGARLRHALSRNWALTAEYFRYAYDFSRSPEFPSMIGVSERFTRNSIRGGVLVFLPIAPR